VEHVAALRTIPNLVVIRPADANEVTQAWKVAILRRNGPTVLVLTRQAIPTLDRSIYGPADGLCKGAYVLADMGDSKPDLILMASGSEVYLIIEAGVRLASEGVNVRLVSFPSWELFETQEETYRDQVFPPEIKARLSIEAGVSQGWERWVGDAGEIISIEKFGASAPYKIIFENYGLTVDNIIYRSRQILSKNNG
jgi:transketolase